MTVEKVKKEIIEYIKYIVGAFVFALILNNTVVINAQVISPSMERTIMTNSKIIGLRTAYMFHDPERFDIVVFKFPDDESSYPFVKRVIGLPGETIEIIDGKVYINNDEYPLDDVFVNGVPFGNHGPFIIPEDSYFVLGDNRNHSHDSKDWENKYVAKDKILGKVYLEWYPDVQKLY